MRWHSPLASSGPALLRSRDLVRRDRLALIVLIGAVLLLLYIGSSFFHHFASQAGGRLAPELRVAGTALALNVALLFFGWRHYVDLQYQEAKCADGERQAALLASTDPVTGLGNRSGFADHGERLRARAAEHGDRLVVLSIQMTRLKAINDRHGQEVSDRLMRLIAEAILDVLPPSAVAGRVSSDEFAVVEVVATADPAGPEDLGRRLLRAISRPFEIDGKLIQVGAYAGIAEHDATSMAVADLLRRADIALDHAKANLASAPRWFDGGMEQALLARSEIEQGIRLGLADDQFVPVFEPQFDLRTGALVGFEVLARWQHPTRGIIGPDQFIPIAEESGLIGQLSERIIRSALEQSARWPSPVKIAVNISPAQLADLWLAEKIVRLLTETGFPAERLMIEITESSLFADLDLARSIATSLKNQGIRLALDDFGTGFSSLAHLRALPFDMIKIDRGFVAALHTDRESAAIIRAVTTLAEAIDVPVTIEGIEDPTTHGAVLGYGCVVGQGWYLGKPMTAEQAAQLLASGEAAAPPSPRRTAARA